MTARQGLLPFTIDAEPRADVASFAGLPLIVERLGALVRKPLERIRGCTAASPKRSAIGAARRHPESLVCLIAAGGDCLDDLERLRADRALQALLGFEVSSPSQAKELLYRFHQAEDGLALDSEDDARLSSAGVARTRAPCPPPAADPRGQGR